MVCYVNFLSPTSLNTTDESTARSIVWDHKLHVAGGASGLATMVVVFLEVVVVLWPFANLSYVGFRTKNLKEKVNNVTSCPTLACTTPIHQVANR
jgi:hypothetical protein